jgi:tellurite resistance protein
MPETSHPTDLVTATLSSIVTTLAEDAIFVLASDGGSKTSLEGLAKRRADAYAALLQGVKVPRMTDDFHAWVIELTRAVAPLDPPSWMPMADVVREKVTLEIGARGLRSLFSSKPSDKEVQRVKRLGTLATRVLRCVFAADGNIDAEEARTLAALIGSFGLPQVDAAPLYTEEVLGVDKLDVYGEVEPAVARAIVRGAWLAAAWDTIDPREEFVVRTVGQKLGIDAAEVEVFRAEAIAGVDARRLAGLAAVDAIRYVLSDRVPGTGVQVAAQTGALMLPRRYREEALAQVGHGAPVALARRYVTLQPEERTQVLGIAWAAALHDDPSVARQCLLRRRYDKVAEDLDESGDKARRLVGEWLEETLVEVSAQMR